MFSERLEIRIISGEFGGRRLKSPKKTQEVRPALDRVKESLFSILHMDLPGSRVLDLCSGTGSLGLEALSRGASHVDFVEGDFDVARILQENIEDLGVADRTEIHKGRLPALLGHFQGKQFNFIFFDPPYAADISEAVFRKLEKEDLLKANGTLIYKRDVKMSAFETECYTLGRRHRVGESEILFFSNMKNSVEEESK